MIKRLRIKFIAIMMSVVTVMMLFVFGTVYVLTRSNLERETLRTMEDVLSDPRLPGFAGKHNDRVNLPYFVLEISRSGRIVSYSGGYYDLSDTDFLLSVAETALVSRESTGEIRDYNLRYMRAEDPFGWDLVFVDSTSEHSTLSSLVKTCVLIGVLSLAVFFALSVLLARWATAPVSEAWSQQRQFVADASHELKTPLTVIMTNAEMLSAQEDPSVREKLSTNILAMSQQMRGLVESLLELARVDNGSAQIVYSPVDFSALAENAVLPFEPLFFEASRTLDTDIEGGISLIGSERHLRQIIEILLDNALKYSKADTAVSLSLHRQGHKALLTVTSRGDELSAQECRDIFKRFYRADKARAMNHSYGLGLSIAQSVAEAHKGRIWAESRSGENSFYVSLPIQ